MTEHVEFTPEQQAKIDEIVKQRVARERERFEKESGAEDLKAQLAAKDEEIAQIRREQFLKDAQRDVRAELARRGVTDEGRVQRIEKLIDFSEASDSSFAVAQIDDVARDLPELVRPRGAGSRG